jgi:hypothetical protein
VGVCLRRDPVERTQVLPSPSRDADRGDRWSPWLDPTASGQDRLDLLVPAAPGSLEAYPVSPLVSNVRNNGPELLEPLPLDESPA